MTEKIIGKSRASVSAWTPADLASIAYWFRADLDCVTTGQGVSSWMCQVSGVALVQTTDANRPPLSSGVVELNNKPAVQFSSSPATWLDANNAASAWRFLHDGTGMRIIVPAVSRVMPGGSGYLFGTCDAVVTSTGALINHAASGPDDYQVAVICNGGGAARVVNSQPFVAAGTFKDAYHVYSFAYTNGASPEYRNTFDFGDIDTGSDSDTPSASDPEGPLRINGAVAPGGGASTHSINDIPEIILCTSDPTGPESTKLQQYLTARYVA